MDIAKSAGSGLLRGLASLADVTNPATAAMGGIETGLQLSGRPDVAEQVRKQAPPSVTQQVQPLGAGYKPTTTAGRYTQSVAEMAPNAVMGPEGLIPRAAAVVLPGIAKEAARSGAQALGAPPALQGVAEFGGALAGGMTAGGLSAFGAPQAISKAERPVASALQSALDVGQTTMPEIAPRLAAGVPPMAAAPGLAQTAETVASLPGPGVTALETAARGRLTEQTPRTLQSVNDILGVDPKAAQGDIDQIVRSGQQTVAPEYASYDADKTPLWNNQLADLAKRPVIADTIKRVATGMLNRGEDPRALGFKLDPDTGWSLNGGPEINEATGGVTPGVSEVEMQPTAGAWIRVHQALGGMVERSPLTNKPLPTLPNSTNEGVEVAGRDLKSALAGDPENGIQGAIPGYADTLAKGGDYLSVRGAFNRASGKLLSPSTSVADFQKMWNSLRNPAEQNAAQAAMANDILLKSEGPQFLPGAFKTSGVQQKLGVAFGPDKAQQFINQTESDIAERGTYNKILQNSATARRTALQSAWEAQNQPKGIGPLVAKGLGAAKWVQALSHPPLFATMVAENALKGTERTGGAPWASPKVSASLGELLSDPEKFAAFMARAQKQQAMEAARPNALTGARYAIPAVNALTGRKESRR